MDDISIIDKENIIFIDFDKSEWRKLKSKNSSKTY